MKYFYAVCYLGIALLLSSCSGGGEDLEERSVCIDSTSVALLAHKTTTGSGNDDTTPPVLTFNGEDPLVLRQGENYNRECAVAVDDVDGAVTVYIVDDHVDTSTIGTYIVKFYATDMARNMAELERTIQVVSKIGYKIEIEALTDTNPNIAPKDFEIDVDSTKTNTQLMTLRNGTDNPMHFLDRWHLGDPYRIAIVRVVSNYPYYDFKIDGILTPVADGIMPNTDLNLVAVPTYRIEGRFRNWVSSPPINHITIVDNIGNKSTVVNGTATTYKLTIPILEFGTKYNLSIYDDSGGQGHCTFDTASADANISGAYDETTVNILKITCQ